MANVKFLTGMKSKIDEHLSIGLIDNGDVILTSDTDELVFINPKTGKRVIKAKTQKPYTLNGTSLGGLEDGATIEAGVSIDELLDLITKKAIPAHYQSPTILLSELNDNTGLITKEIGETLSLKLKSVFNQNDAGSVISHKFFKNNDMIYENNTNFAEITTETFSFTEEPLEFYSQVEFSSGEIKNDSFGNPSYDNAIEQGFLLSEKIECLGQRNLFFGTGTGEIPNLNSENIRFLESKILNPIENMKFSILVNEGEQYLIFAYPSYLRDVHNITYKNMNDSNMALNFDKTLVDVSGANNYSALEYKVYTYKMAAPAVMPMTFEITI